MNAISNELMIMRLSENINKNAHELETIQSFSNVKCFQTGNVSVIVCMPSSTYCTVNLIMDSWSDLNKITFSDLRIDSCPQVVISINGSAAMSEGQIEIKGFSYENYYKSFVKETGFEKDFQWNIRELSQEDQELVESCPIIADDGRPPFQAVFDMLIGEKTGRILACVENNVIIAYLAFVQSIEHFQDVAELYVMKEYRRKGIATDLGRKYANTVLSEGGKPYWSNAVSIGSERAAEKSGFVQCCSHYYYKKVALA